MGSLPPIPARSPAGSAAPGGGSNPASRRGVGARILSALAVVAVSLIVPLILLEIGLRLFAPQTTAVNVSEWDPHYGWRNRPNARGFFHTPEFRMEVKINSFGHRDDETTLEKPAGTFRLLGLGDSFAFGHGVAADSCFYSVAERELDEASRAAGGPRVELLNTGVGKWGTAPEFLYLEREGFGFEPDAVVLAFCVDNDFENNADGNLLRLEGDRLVRVENPEPTMRKAQRITRLIPGYEFLAEHSHLVNFVRVRASVLDSRAILARAQQQSADSAAAAAAGPDWRARRLPVTLMLMDSLAARTREAGVGFLVLVIPSRWQTVPESRWPDPAAAEGAPGKGRPRSRWGGGGFFEDPRPRAAMAETLVAHLDSIGVPVVYPLEALRADGATRELYFEEQHLNERGSRIVGEALADGLERAGLVPATLGGPDSIAPRIPGSLRR